MSALSFAFGVPAASSSVGSEDNAAAAAAAAAAVADTGDGAGASPPACSNVDANSAAKAKASPDSRWCTSLSYRSDPCVSMRWRIALAALSSSDVGASGRPRSHVMNDAAGGGGQLRRELACGRPLPPPRKSLGGVSVLWGLNFLNRPFTNCVQFELSMQRRSVPA